MNPDDEDMDDIFNAESVLITDWQGARDVAIDLTVVHGLNQSEAWDLITPAVEKAERANIIKYHALCEAANLDFVPLGMNTFGFFLAPTGSSSWASCSRST